MNLWLSSVLLVAELFLGCSALTPEECQPLVTPLSLADPSLVNGRSNLLMVYTDNKVFDILLNNTQSSWFNFSSSPSIPNKGVMSQWNRMIGKCMISTVNVTIVNNTASSSVANVSSVFQMLPAFYGCRAMRINTTATNFDKMVDMMGFTHEVTAGKVEVHALYLLCRDTMMKDSDLEHFNQQASCLGFSGEPNFLYNPKNAFCAEDDNDKLV